MILVCDLYSPVHDQRSHTHAWVVFFDIMVPYIEQDCILLLGIAVYIENIILHTSTLFMCLEFRVLGIKDKSV